MLYLSIDCANKSLAIGLYKVDNNLFKNIKDCNHQHNNYNINDYEYLKNKYQTQIQILHCEVIDIIPGQKVQEVSIIDRSYKLKQVLNELNDKLQVHYNNEIVNVLIEYQMNINDKSRSVSNQLIYEYSDINKYKIIIMKPMLKNTVYLDTSLQYCNIIKNYNSSYRCNKNHAKLNFLYFIDTFNLQDKIKNIKKSNLDDIADTFMQMIAYIIYN